MTPFVPIPRGLRPWAVAGVLLALPWLMYQAWAFVAPGLYGHEKRLARPLMIFGIFSVAPAARWLILSSKNFRREKNSSLSHDRPVIEAPLL